MQSLHTIQDAVNVTSANPGLITQMFFCINLNKKTNFKVEYEVPNITKMKIDEKLIEELGKSCTDILEIIELIRNGFNQHSFKILEQASEKARFLHKSENSILEKMIGDIKEHPNARFFVAIPPHLERIGDKLESMINCTRIKTSEVIMFSDKAVNELNYLMDTVKNILKCMKDMIITRNGVLIKTTLDEAETFGKIASDYATEHEERLISGTCAPRASSIYLDMLDSLREIAVHSKEIAQVVASIP